MKNDIFIVTCVKVLLPPNTEKWQSSILTFGTEFRDKCLIEYWSFSHKLLYKHLQSGVLYSLQVNFHDTIFSFHTWIDSIRLLLPLIRVSQSKAMFQSASEVISLHRTSLVIRSIQANITLGYLLYILSDLFWLKPP